MLSLLSVECMLHCYFIIKIIVIICGVYVTLLFHYQNYRYYLWSVYYTVISISILSLLSVECMLHCYFIILSLLSVECMFTLFISLSKLSLLSVECMLHCYFIIKIIVIICGVYVTRTVDRDKFWSPPPHRAVGVCLWWEPDDEKKGLGAVLRV